MMQRGVALVKLNKHPIDFRVLLLKPSHRWELMGIMGKMASGNKIVTNFNHGGQPIRFRTALSRAGWSEQDMDGVLRKIQRLCLTTARTFNKKYKYCRKMGIDIALNSSKQIWILEVNTNPTYDLFKYHGNKKLYGTIKRHYHSIEKRQSTSKLKTGYN
jgi:hypothetical protein